MLYFQALYVKFNHTGAVTYALLYDKENLDFITESICRQYECTSRAKIYQPPKRGVVYYIADKK